MVHVADQSQVTSVSKRALIGPRLQNVAATWPRALQPRVANERRTGSGT